MTRKELIQFYEEELIRLEKDYKDSNTDMVANIRSGDYSGS